MSRRASCKILIVDLNNFAHYPTIAVGYLAALLRAASVGVDVFSPLRFGVPGVTREPPETWARAAARRLSYSAAWGRGPVATIARRVRRLGDRQGQGRRGRRIVAEFGRALNRGYDAVLVSTYLMYHPVCVEIGRLCEARGVPLLIGGSYFVQPAVAEEWRDIPGLSALVGGEVEPYLVDLVGAAVAGEDLARFPGSVLPGGARGPACPPLRDLDGLPFPDYSDFPWEAYRDRIIPMITGRGCGWSACTFCSDITSSMGRTYRSRSVGNVLDEVGHQARRHSARLFTFTDLKLNSDLAVWEGLLGHLQDRAPGAHWIGAVHVGSRQPNGLGAVELRAARAAGMVRVTTGLESGSQRMLDLMRKGTDVAETSRFIRDAHSSGISVRATMIHGYPGEQAEDVEQSARFLERHADALDRVSLNRFQLMVGPGLLRRIVEEPVTYPDVADVRVDARTALASHRHLPAGRPDYRRATRRLLDAVSAINRKALGHAARPFEGVM